MLSPKQRKFVAEYLKDQNGTQAAIRAGYSKKTARVQASDLLMKPDIKSAVEAKLAKVEENAVVDATFILTSLKTIAERCMQGSPVMEFNHDTKSLEPTGEWEFDSSGANRSLELLGKHLKMFTDRIEHSGIVTYEKLLAGTE